MNEIAPAWLDFSFLLVTSFAIITFFFSSRRSFPVLSLLVGWSVFYVAIGSTMFFAEANSVPPRPLFLLLPTIVAFILLFSTQKGKGFVDNLDIKWLTYLHAVRIGVELIFHQLYLEGAMPQLLTYEGRNIDIVIGITAPFVAYWGFTLKKVSNTVLIIWNVVGILLVSNAVVHGVFSMPTIFQQFAFDQPNIALLQAPYILVPALIVPLVYLAHLGSLRQLRRRGAFGNTTEVDSQ